MTCVPTSPEPPTLLYLMKQLELAVRARLDDLVRDDGLTALQYTALTVLDRHPDLTSAQLARRSFVTAQTMAEMVSGLLSRELVERHRDEHDRRRLVLSLTPAGRALLARHGGAVAELEREMLAELDDVEAAQLRVSTLKCLRALGIPTGPDPTVN